MPRFVLPRSFTRTLALVGPVPWQMLLQELLMGHHFPALAAMPGYPHASTSLVATLVVEGPKAIVGTRAMDDERT